MAVSYSQSAAARLAASQVIYQWLHTGAPIKECLQAFLDKHVGMEIEGEKMEKPDRKLLSTIISGVEERKDDLLTFIAGARNGEQSNMDYLLTAILLAGSYEIMMGKTDIGILINDYCNVGHAFYEKPEVSLVNAILDAVHKNIT